MDDEKVIADGDASAFKYRILIVEDDEGLREFGKLLLTGQGYEILCAETASKVWRLLSNPCRTSSSLT